MPTGDHYYYPTSGMTNGTFGPLTVGKYQLTTTTTPTSTWNADNSISASFNGKIHVHGIDEIREKLSLIEERLGMLERNLLLETRYKELKELGERYKQLEQELLEKEKIVEILKK